MKKIIFTFISCVLLTTLSFGQNVPQGMKYQAVARDMEGQVMANQDIQLKITLYSDPESRTIAYEEIHKIITTELGLFSLSVGEGIPMRGQFNLVPWSEKEVWMQVAVQTDDETDFITISDSRMLSVPYAFHAATAGELVGNDGTRGGTGDPYQKAWSLLSNYNTIPGRDVLGTGDMADLVIVTNNKERIRVLQTGDVMIRQSTEVGADLSVKKNVYLNTAMQGNPSQASFEEGETINYGDFTVEKQSKTYLTGTLDVDGATRLHHTLEVEGATQLNNTLDVDGATQLHNTLEVDGASNLNSTLDVDGAARLHSSLDVDGAAELNSTLGVDGITTIKNSTESTAITNGALVVNGGVGIGKNLNVGGDTKFGGSVTFAEEVHIAATTESTSSTTGALTVAGGVGVAKNVNIGGRLGVKGTNTGFMAVIENTDGGTGDGLKIKLGKTHPRWDDNPPPPFSNEISADLPGIEFLSTGVTEMKELFKGLMTSPADEFSIENFISIGESFEEALEAELGADVETYASAACNLTREILSTINSELDLEWNFPKLTVPRIVVPVDFIAPGLPPEEIELVPKVTLTESFEVFPEINLPSCPPPPSLKDWSLPNFKIDDVPNSLGHENQFIQFVDKNDRQVGTIRAESIEEWCTRYLNEVYFLNIYNGFISAWSIGLDPTQVLETAVKFEINAVTEMVNVTETYNKIGVEYSSGFGDYAEWLERADVTEPITPGDIVAVKGGKITRDLTDVEQIMAVSSNPIMLGNTPPAGEAHKGNKIAFMGQIPVKILGPVKSGDFIVANGAIPGYGVAIHPDQMTAEDFGRAVGRAWETIGGEGPKMVNTVVGVHNGGFIHVMKQFEQNKKETDTRLAAIEERLNSIMPLANEN